ncbi:MAG: hypothetical protein C0601_03945 [Candidatus Muiribacterium halophilum]|uniref:ABC transporter permease n=1 Tax=Muiribacterium halophilum TaxID=2053465 RepID=A0A2N5ZJ67_MUIH1|nr:MAG: hypothetical protein C0601_03945 [Candidatus Muirbacterium halophilum]
MRLFIPRWIIKILEALGELLFFLKSNILALYRERFYWDQLISELYSIGVRSLGVVTLAGLFTGMVFVVQVGFNFMKMGAQSYIGGVVALALFRELSPVLVSIIIAGRVGSAMAAEIGTMRISEQVDALVMLSVNPFSYLTVPKILASIIMVPILVIYADFVAVLGGAFVAVSQVGITLVSFQNSIIQWVERYDLMSGIFKAIVFGFVISLISCFNGIRTSGGAKGVGNASTTSVVLSIISILVLDYFLAVFLKYFYVFMYG